MQHQRKVNKTFNNQQGAMFGMDARIAIVIFSILSVGIGAISYHRIQTAKDVAIIKELEALNAAISQFQYDMKTFYPFALNRSLETEDISALWNKNKVKYTLQPRWNGPYYNKETSQNSQYGHYGLEYHPDDMQKKCSYENTCYVWITLSDVEEEAWKNINHIVDQDAQGATEAEGREHLLGKIRSDEFSGVRKLYFRGVSAK